MESKGPRWDGPMTDGDGDAENDWEYPGTGGPILAVTGRNRSTWRGR
jgi:hypothetical protein